LTDSPTRKRFSRHLHLGCFGNFRIEDRVCRNHCAIRIRCAIERDQINILEVIDEMEAAGEGYYLKSK
jgi:hypothetical protein